VSSVIVYIVGNTSFAYVSFICFYMLLTNHYHVAMLQLSVYPFSNLRLIINQAMKNSVPEECACISLIDILPLIFLVE